MPRHALKARTGTDRTSFYDDVTRKIIAELEVGRVPWVRPWRTAAANAPFAMPHNAASRRRYNGINVLILWGAVAERGFQARAGSPSVRHCCSVAASAKVNAVRPLSMLTASCPPKS